MSQFDRKKIVFTHDYPPHTGGGLSINVNEICVHLQDQWDVKVFTSRLEDDFAANKILKNDSLYFYSKSKIILILVYLRELIKSDLLVINFTFSFRFLAFLSILINAVYKKNSILVFHTNLNHLTYNRFKNRPILKRILIKILLASQHKFLNLIVFNDDQNEELSNLGFKNIITLPFPVFFKDKYKGSYQEAKKKVEVIYVGELSSLKGSEFLIMLLSIELNFNLTIIGDGHLYFEIWRLALKSKNVKVFKTKSHSDTIKYIKRSQILFFPCINDSWGRIVFESMYSNTLVVGFKNGALKAIPNKYFVEIEKADDLVGLIKDFGSKQEYYKKIIDDANLFAKIFNKELVERWEKILTIKG